MKTVDNLGLRTDRSDDLSVCVLCVGATTAVMDHFLFGAVYKVRFGWECDVREEVGSFMRKKIGLVQRAGKILTRWSNGLEQR